MWFYTWFDFIATRSFFSITCAVCLAWEREKDRTIVAIVKPYLAIKFWRRCHMILSYSYDSISYDWFYRNDLQAAPQTPQTFNLEFLMMVIEITWSMRKRSSLYLLNLGNSSITTKITLFSLVLHHASSNTSPETGLIWELINQRREKQKKIKLPF